MGSIGNIYERIRTSKRHTTQANALADTEAKSHKAKVQSCAMIYNYLTGVQKSMRERFCKYLWLTIAVFVAVMLWDMIFNYSRLFVDILFWTSQ